jgi:hypothetical protein
LTKAILHLTSRDLEPWQTRVWVEKGERLDQEDPVAPVKGSAAYGHIGKGEVVILVKKEGQA